MVGGGQFKLVVYSTRVSHENYDQPYHLKLRSPWAGVWLISALGSTPGAPEFNKWTAAETKERSREQYLRNVL